MPLPLHDIAALGTATCWATSALFSAEAVRALGAFHFNLIRQVFVTLLLALAVWVTGSGTWPGLVTALTLALSGVLGILVGDTFNFAAVGRLGPRRAGAVFALNAPMAAGLGWLFLGESLDLQASLGIGVTVAGVALAILGRSGDKAHRLESLHGRLAVGLGFGLLAGLGQATGALIARPILHGGLDPYLASLIRVGASGAVMSLLAPTPLAPARAGPFTARALFFSAMTAFIGLFLGMTLFLYALQGGQTGIIATLSATSPVIILPLLWLRTGQRPRPLSWAGALIAVVGLALIFLRQS